MHFKSLVLLFTYLLPIWEVELHLLGGVARVEGGLVTLCRHPESLFSANQKWKGFGECHFTIWWLRGAKPWPVNNVFPEIVAKSCNVCKIFDEFHSVGWRSKNMKTDWQLHWVPNTAEDTECRHLCLALLPSKIVNISFGFFVISDYLLSCYQYAKNKMRNNMEFFMERNSPKSHNLKDSEFKVKKVM